MKLEDQFIQSFHGLAHEASVVAEAHGWYINTKSTDSLAAKIALMHSELSEALEALRHGNPPSDHIPEFSGMEEEFADVIIRIMHVAWRMELNVPEAIIAKTKFNDTRKYKHGGKEI